MSIPRHFCLCLLVAVTPIGTALAQPATCHVVPFQGATSPQGAVAQMRVVNTGSPCAIANHGLPAERGNPAGSGNITRQPAHGKAEFIAPHARYTPEPGFAGEDEFEYEAFARGRANQEVHLTVRVKVLVVAP